MLTVKELIIKLLNKIYYLFFSLLILTGCESNDDSVLDNLLGQWNWTSTTVTVTDDDGNFESEETRVPSEDDTWMLTFNDDNSYTSIRCCFEGDPDDGDAVDDDTYEMNGTWSAESGILTMTIYEEDGDPDGTYELDYIISNESNTLTLNEFVDEYYEDDYGNWSHTAVNVYVFDRVE